MFEAQQQAVESNIRAYCAKSGLPEPDALPWSPIPFSGEWGITTSFFQLAAQEARQIAAQGGTPGGVGQRAQEIAAGAAAHLGKPAGFSRVEAVKGYLNLYFSPTEYTRAVVGSFGSPPRDLRMFSPVLGFFV